MTVQADFIEPGDPRWLATLATTAHDFYHLPGYSAFAARHAGGKACAFLGRVDDAALLIPLVLRPLPHDLDAPPAWRDAASPYGYASPLVVGAPAPPVEAELWQAFRQACREESIVAAFLRFHPLLPPAVAGAAVGSVIEEGETVYLDLTASRQEILGRMRNNHRRDIRTLRAAGYVTVIDDWSGLQQFAALYRATMVRAGAVAEYLFDDDYFAALVAIDSDNIHLCSVAAPDGRLAAAGLFFRCGGIVQFHLSGTAADFAAQSPTKLMFDEMGSWAKARGCTSLHLGGGVGCRNDSLFNFKAGFSPCRAVYRTLRVICRPDEYASLTARSGSATQAAAGSDNFFPAYRRTRFA